jgi:tripartite-type tricarboxylate transporter receptor subunit TctC
MASDLIKHTTDATFDNDVLKADKQKFLEQGAEPRGWSPEQTAKFVRDESEKWQAVIKTTNVSLD